MTEGCGSLRVSQDCFKKTIEWNTHHLVCTHRFAHTSCELTCAVQLCPKKIGLMARSQDWLCNRVMMGVCRYRTLSTHARTICMYIIALKKRNYLSNFKGWRFMWHEPFIWFVESENNHYSNAFAWIREEIRKPRCGGVNELTSRHFPLYFTHLAIHTMSDEIKHLRAFLRWNLIACRRTIANPVLRYDTLMATTIASKTNLIWKCSQEVSHRPPRF